MSRGDDEQISEQIETNQTCPIARAKYCSSVVVAFDVFVVAVLLPLIAMCIARCSHFAIIQTSPSKVSEN